MMRKMKMENNKMIIKNNLKMFQKIKKKLKVQKKQFIKMKKINKKM